MRELQIEQDLTTYGLSNSRIFNLILYVKKMEDAGRHDESVDVGHVERERSRRDGEREVLR